MKTNETKKPSSLPLLIAVSLTVVCLGLLLTLRHHGSDGNKETQKPDAPKPAKSANAWPVRRSLAHASATAGENSSAEAIVAKKISQFAQKQRAVFEALVAKHNIAVPDEVKRFFEAIEAGRWEEAGTLFKQMQVPGNPSGSRSQEIRPYWRPIQDTWGATMMAQKMPAQKYLDYGNAILDSLRPGMVYVGGTDPGMFIPNMLNATSEGEQHIVLTQNALADATYLDYLNFLYGDKLKTLTSDDSQRAFQEYIEGAQKRQQHDQDFPDEPKQLRPEENIKIENGKTSPSGQGAVMAINEILLQNLLQKNPEMSFALEESRSLPSLYASAAPFGSLMELRAPGGQNTFNSEIATQTVDYWNTTAQKLLADPEAAGSPDTLLTYSHDAVAQANLLAAHDFSAQAEQAYNLASQLSPTNFEAVAGLSDVFNHTGRSEQAIQLLNEYAQKNPNLKKAVDRQLSQLTVAQPKR